MAYVPVKTYNNSPTAMGMRPVVMVQSAPPQQPPQYTYKQQVQYLSPVQAKKSMDVPGRCTKVVAASGLGGAVLLGGGGGFAGLLTGGLGGAAVGLVPALFTFGLSIPIGAVIGGTCGTVVGAVGGGTVGLTGGSAVGYISYKKRAELRTLFLNTKMKITGVVRRTRTKTVHYADMLKKKSAYYYQKTKHTVRTKASQAKARATRAAQAAKTKATRAKSDKDVRAAAKAGVGGAVVLGAGGAAAGTLTGGVIGGALGVVPAIFTFGLSIPFCAVVGGGCGLVAGSTVGGTAGAVTGAGSYWAWAKRQAIRGSLRSTVEKVARHMPVFTQSFLSRFAARLGGSAPRRLLANGYGSPRGYANVAPRSPVRGYAAPRSPTGSSQGNSPYGGATPRQVAVYLQQGQVQQGQAR